MSNKFFMFRIIVVFCLNILFVDSVKSVERIISLAPSITKNIYVLQNEDKLVGCTSYCTLAKNDGKEVIGSAIAVNIEKSLLLHPDLVLATTITNPEIIETFRKVGIKVVIFKTPVNFEEICTQLIDLGKIISAEKKASEIVKASNSILDSLKNTVPQFKKKKIFFQIGANPIFTVLTNTFMDDFISFAGGENVCADLKRGTVSREMVLLRNPDIIIISDMGGIGNQEMKIWNQFADLNAIKNNNIFIVDSDKSCSPTPTDFVSVLKDIINSINY